MRHRVATSEVRGIAVLRVCDFPGLARDRPHVGFHCIVAEFGLRAATTLEVRSGSKNETALAVGRCLTGSILSESSRQV